MQSGSETIPMNFSKFFIKIHLSWTWMDFLWIPSLIIWEELTDLSKSSKCRHISLIIFLIYIHLFHCWFFSEKSFKDLEAVMLSVADTSFSKVLIFVFKTQILLLPINTVGCSFLKWLLTWFIFKKWFAKYPSVNNHNIPVS